jgi:phosphotransacetylase
MTDFIENRTYDELQVGDSASLEHRLTMHDIKLSYAKSSPFQEVIAHGMWGGSLISTVLGTQLPGPGTIYLGQTLKFRRPVGLDDVLTVTVTVAEKQQRRRVLFACQCVNQDGEKVITGDAEVMAPKEKIRRPRFELPSVRLSERTHLREFVRAGREAGPVPTAVVHPKSPRALKTLAEAAAEGIIEPVLIGPASTIAAAAESAGVDVGAWRVVDVEHSQAAAARAVALARAGEVRALLQGSRQLEELLRTVLTRGSGLRTGRRASHVYAFDVPTYGKPLFITDAGLNVSPDLDAKRDIIQNAVDLLHALGYEEPKVACLAAVERLNRAVQSTMDAAALCKMADRGQITGARVDGPLAFDTAISHAAGMSSGFDSPVAGDADLLVVPDLESGSMVAHQLRHLGDAGAAGIVLGARVPVVVTSPHDAPLDRLASCALAALAARRPIDTGA